MTNPQSEFLARVADVFGALDHSPVSPDVVSAYDAFKRGLVRQYPTIPYRVRFTADDPYGPDSRAMFDSVERSGILRVYTGGNLLGAHPLSHPVLLVDSAQTVSFNSIFRAVHDGLVHIPNRLSFSPLSEWRAFQIHARMFAGNVPEHWRPLGNGVRALATETLGHTAHYATFGTFTDTKACILPDDLIRQALYMEL